MDEYDLIGDNIGNNRSLNDLKDLAFEKRLDEEKVGEIVHKLFLDGLVTFFDTSNSILGFANFPGSNNNDNAPLMLNGHSRGEIKEKLKEYKNNENYM